MGDPQGFLAGPTKASVSRPRVVRRAFSGASSGGQGGGSVRSVEAIPTVCLPALEPLVDVLAADLKESGQPSEGEDDPVEHLGEGDLLVHGECRSPGHRLPPEAHSGGACYASTRAVPHPLEHTCENRFAGLPNPTAFPSTCGFGYGSKRQLGQRHPGKGAPLGP